MVWMTDKLAADKSSRGPDCLLAYQSSIDGMESNDRPCVASRNYPVIQVLLHPPDVHCAGGHDAYLALAAAFENGQQRVLADSLPCHKMVSSQIPHMQMVLVYHQQLHDNELVLCWPCQRTP